MSGQNANRDILDALSHHLTGPVPVGTNERARLHLLDWLGCAVAGKTEAVGKVFSLGPPAGLTNTSFYWGALGNILEMDDVDKRALLHPGPSIIPAALASLQKTDASVCDFLNALVRGYESTIRLGRAVGPGHYAKWHNTGTCGAIGAAAAASHVHKLKPAEVATAMSYAVSISAGLWQTRHSAESMGKQLHTAHAARTGEEAAWFASAGFIGPSNILDGEQGFFQAMCPDGYPLDVLKDYNKAWLIEDVSFKPWPACRHTHPAIDAALKYRTKIGNVSENDQIELVTYSDALKFCDRPDPKSTIEAKFSLQHAIAVALVQGEPELEDFAVENLNKRSVAAMRARVSVGVDPELSNLYPQHFGAKLCIGGHEIPMPDALGDPENPVSSDHLKSKASKLFRAGGMTAVQASDITSLILEVKEDEPALKIFHAVEQVLS